MSPRISKVINVLETEDTKIWKYHIPQSTQAIIDDICLYEPFGKTVLCPSENHHIHISINMPSVINKFWKSFGSKSHPHSVSSAWFHLFLSRLWTEVGKIILSCVSMDSFICTSS